MTPRKPLILLKKSGAFAFQLVSRPTTKSRHFGREIDGKRGGKPSKFRPFGRGRKDEPRGTMRLDYYSLSPTRINNAKAKDKLYKLSDGGGLFIEVSPTGQKTWRYQYRFGWRRAVTSRSAGILRSALPMPEIATSNYGPVGTWRRSVRLPTPGAERAEGACRRCQGRRQRVRGLLQTLGPRAADDQVRYLPQADRVPT